MADEQLRVSLASLLKAHKSEGQDDFVGLAMINKTPSAPRQQLNITDFRENQMLSVSNTSKKSTIVIEQAPDIAPEPQQKLTLTDSESDIEVQVIDPMHNPTQTSVSRKDEDDYTTFIARFA